MGGNSGVLAVFHIGVVREAKESGNQWGHIGKRGNCRR